jgi:hypothetical protein
MINRRSQTQRRFARPTTSASISSESLEPRQLMSADGVILETAPNSSEQLFSPPAQNFGHASATSAVAAEEMGSSSLFQHSFQAQSPSPQGRTTSSRPQFQWPAVAGASRYELWVNNAAGQRVLHSNTLPQNSTVSQIDLPAGNYRWWHRAFNAAGTALRWSDAFDFSITGSQPLQPPTAQSPIGSTSIATPQFTWTATPGAARYEVWVNNTTTRQRVLHSDTLTTNSATSNIRLADGEYTWWVRSIGADGRASGWSHPAVFRVASAPTAPRLMAPVGNVPNGTPQFQWTAVAGASRYELWVSSLDTNQRVLHGTQLTGTTAHIEQGQLADGRYRWWVRGLNASGQGLPWSTPADFVVRSGGGDDQFEPNNSIQQAVDFGGVNPNVQIGSLSLADGQDWFTFTIDGTATSSNFVRTRFDHSLGDIDLIVTDSAGRVVRKSDTATNEEFVSLAGLTAGRYFVQVYGFEGAKNPRYSLEINAALNSSTTRNDAYRTLFLNFDGAFLSRASLEQMSNGQWFADAITNNFDADGNGVTVGRFMNGHGQREAVIQELMNILQADLNPYGITVQRITGGPVIGQGATTIFMGPSDVTAITNGWADGVASSIDRGNDNLTDIAFYKDFMFSQINQSTLLAYVDTILHEAGHTWGLFHVETISNGRLVPETMGFVYTINQHKIQLQQFPDTGFLDITLTEYANHGLNSSNTAETQNSHREMLAVFGTGDRSRNQSLALVDMTQAGLFSIQTHSSTDAVSILEQGAGSVLISINGEQYLVSGGLEQIRIVAADGTTPQLSVSSELAGMVVVETGTLAIVGSTKLPSTEVAIWNGTQLREHRCTHPGHSHGDHDHGDHDHDSCTTDHTANEEEHEGDCGCSGCLAVNVARQSLFADSNEIQELALQSSRLTAERRTVSSKSARTQRARKAEVTTSAASGIMLAVAEIAEPSLSGSTLSTLDQWFASVFA